MESDKRVLMLTGNGKDRPLIYVLRGESGDLLIDTGTELCTHQLDNWIKENHFDIKWVFLTHGHFDHTWNCRFLKEKYGAKVILHEKDRDIFCLDEKRDVYGTSEKNETFAHFANTLNSETTAPFCRVDIFLTDEDTGYLRTLGFDADIVMLHGHTAGSMGILKGRVLYAGDALSAKRGDYYTAFIGENVEEVFRTEERIFGLNPLVIAPGHGQLVINEKTFEG